MLLYRLHTTAWVLGLLRVFLTIKTFEIRDWCQNPAPTACFIKFNIKNTKQECQAGLYLWPGWCRKPTMNGRFNYITGVTSLNISQGNCRYWPSNQCTYNHAYYNVKHFWMSLWVYISILVSICILLMWAGQSAVPTLRWEVHDYFWTGRSGQSGRTDWQETGSECLCLRKY